jgi:pimeloyl-ACP methyl ester carboxylesterase
MPKIQRPDGATIHYEVFGQGYPLLLFAPGGVNSEIAFWDHSAVNPIRDFADEFMVIGMDQRHAGQSPAPAEPFSYDLTVGDQLAVLDDLGVERAHVMGGCIGVAYNLRVVKEAPSRISAAVCQDPVGVDDSTSIDVFNDMFAATLAVARSSGVKAVVEAAMTGVWFVENNAAGPFARRIHDDAVFRDEILGMSDAEYVALIEAFIAGIWPPDKPLFSVTEDWLKSCPAPLLVLPGSDPFHPMGISHRICELAPQGKCLDIDCRSPAKLAGTMETIRAFLRTHAA